MILSDKRLRRLLKNGDIVVEPIEENQIQPSSIDLRLGNEFLIYTLEGGIIDVTDNNIDKHLKRIEVGFEEGFIIQPKQFVLATTIEYIELPNYITAFVEGRSSLGRLGLFIENAGWVDAGFKGNITLEFFNANLKPLKIYPGMRICQLVFSEMKEPAERGYMGKYLGQRGTTASKIYIDKDIKR